MRRILTTTLLLVLLASFAATGVPAQSKHATAYEKKSYSLPAFKAISANAGIDVLFSPGQGRNRAEAEAVRELLPYLSMTVKNGTLVITMKNAESVMRNNRLRNSKPITVRVTGGKDIDALRTSAGAEIEVTGHLKSSGELQLSASSGGEIHLKKGMTCTTLHATAAGGGELQADKVTCGTLRADASGGGEIELKGISADHARASASGGGEVTLAGVCRRSADLKASGGGEVDADDLKSSKTTATASGGGKISCDAQRCSLTARASSGGTVSYQGTPIRLIRESKEGIRHKK